MFRILALVLLLVSTPIAPATAADTGETAGPLPTQSLTDECHGDCHEVARAARKACREAGGSRRVCRMRARIRYKMCVETECVPVCPDRLCAADNYCPYGPDIDANGCPTCDCKEPRCSSNADCPTDSHCEIELCLNSCADDVPGCRGRCFGMCVPNDCVCPDVYAPVCGVDGVTYGNSCEARCAGVRILHEGECRDECRSNQDCPDKLICYPPTQQCQPQCEIACFRYDPVCGTDGVTYGCGQADAFCHGVEVAHPGECRDPCVCTEEYQPVCGVDGVTYSNACFARCAGVEIAHEGECRDHCRNNEDCRDDLICYPPTDTCQPQCEIACFRYDPVCGTDGGTYGCGEQDAFCHGAEVEYPGECRCYGDQDCPDGTRCDAADVCLPPPGCGPDLACPAVCTGHCVADPCVCPDIYDPVCGVDGVTYGNSCQARCAGVEIAHRGKCKDDGLCRELGVPMEICPLVLCAPTGGDPVCGVNGETYPNACMACCGAGVEIEHRGECRGDCPPLMCGVFCELGYKVGPDGCPTCQCNEPCLCTEEYQPVCGVDGVTYSNTCFARCASVEIAHEGECRSACDVPACDIACEHGFVTGPDGCATCQCKPDPMDEVHRLLQRMSLF